MKKWLNKKNLIFYFSIISSLFLGIGNLFFGGIYLVINNLLLQPKIKSKAHKDRL